ncbi:MAG: BadF/BadG/BcrA/BcrD ATPase family protein, partial [Bacteroidales bacterium]
YAVKQGLLQFDQEMKDCNKQISIAGSAVTGYGEDLIRAAFGIEHGVVETIAHYTAAHFLNPKISFVLDIGGQDMKAIFVKNGEITRVELNEACSSGCGSFIETFGQSLGYSAPEFAALACTSQKPCDLGTRCTVFMNSKVKQALRENATTADIAAGLSYSVIKNCLYKVLKFNNLDDLGDHIVVQGGAFKNASLQRALEVLTGKKATCSKIPELMGAYGAALIAMK